ncbi:MAG: hypothetical protein KC431_27520 [Myxococcales bacterium]|nr:hypothetical protein [Myxococcales bacterium]
MTLEFCKSLRWKSISRDLDDPNAIALAFVENRVPYTCLRTCQHHGPDDALVAPELCHSERSCFVPSPLTLRLRARAQADQ